MNQSPRVERHRRRGLARPARGGALALACAVAAGVTGAAQAQFGEAAGFGEMMTPYFLRRDLEFFESGLDLDESQRDILEMLFYDYEDEHETGKTRMLERLSNMREDLEGLERNEILRLVFQPFEDRSREWDQLRDHFLETVKAILSAEQLAQWDSFHRFLRREKELPKGRFSGESVDLFDMVAEMDLAEPIRAPLEPVLEDYSVRLDQALVYRAAQLQDARLAMMHAIRDEDPDSSLVIYERQVDARTQVRDTNDLYREAIAERLPYDLAATFRQLVLEKAYPRIFRPTAAERVFEAAKELEGLEPDTLTAIVELEAGLIAELAEVNRRLVGLLQDFEPEDALYRARSFAMRQVGEKADRPIDPTREVFREREQIGQRYVDLLRELLTPEQFESLTGSQRFLKKSRDAAKNAADRTKGTLGSREEKIRSLSRPESIGSTLNQPPKKDDN